MNIIRSLPALFSRNKLPSRIYRRTIHYPQAGFQKVAVSTLPT
jgi:hypothetical protein